MKTGTRQELVLHIAESLDRDEADSPYIQPGAYDLLEEPVKAANFLVKRGWPDHSGNVFCIHCANLTKQVKLW